MPRRYIRQLCFASIASIDLLSRAFTQKTSTAESQARVERPIGFKMHTLQTSRQLCAETGSADATIS